MEKRISGDGDPLFELIGKSFLNQLEALLGDLFRPKATLSNGVICVKIKMSFPVVFKKWNIFEFAKNSCILQRNFRR